MDESEYQDSLQNFLGFCSRIFQARNVKYQIPSVSMVCKNLITIIVVTIIIIIIIIIRDTYKVYCTAFHVDIHWFYYVFLCSHR